MDFNRFNTFIFDLDETVWCWTELIPGVERIIDRLNYLGKQVLFVTNNTFLSRKGLAKKLNTLGIEAKEENVINPAISISEYIRRRKGRAIVFGDGLKEDLKKDGIKVVKKPPAKYLVVGLYPKFNFQELGVAVEAIEKGAEFLAAAGGRYFRFGNGKLPGTGVIVNAIEYVSDKKSILLGKPSEFFQSIVELNIESSRKETVLFGDELDSDILLGKNAGYFTVLVKTGVDKIVKGKIRPDLVLNSVADVKVSA